MLLAVTAALPGGARAADGGGRFAIKGGGLQECGGFLAAWDGGSGDLALYAGWIEGYLTGLNQHLAETFDLAPWQTTESLLGLARLACDQRPAETRFIDAFDGILRVLLSRRLAEESPIERVERGGDSVVIYTAVVARVQARLTELGYDPGPATGAFSDRTAAALQSYQAEAGLAASGLPDQQTLIRLLLQ